jgi:hypothetical protein
MSISDKHVTHKHRKGPNPLDLIPYSYTYPYTGCRIDLPNVTFIYGHLASFQYKSTVITRTYDQNKTANHTLSNRAVDKY